MASENSNESCRVLPSIRSRGLDAAVSLIFVAFLAACGDIGGSGADGSNVAPQSLAASRQVLLKNTLDFDGDGVGDILWRNNDGGLAIWLISGAGQKSGAGIATVGTDWTIAGSGDYDGDGISDILWRHDSGAVAIWSMNGMAQKSGAGLGTVSTDWKIVASGDFDGDGKSDILWRNDNGQVAIWLMNGMAQKSSAIVATVTSDWTIAGTGDFDGDGKSDILWRNTNGQLAIWLMNGLGQKTGAVIATVSTDWKIAGAGDYDGNGRSDILWRNDDGKVAIWLMNGMAQSSSAVIGTVSTDWKIAGAGDYDADGRSDILWRHDSGSVAIWLMDGMSRKSSAPLGSVVTDWKIASALTGATLYLESALTAAGNLEPNGLVVSKAGKFFDLRLGVADAPTVLSNSDNVTLTMQSVSGAAYTFTRLDGFVANYTSSDPLFLNAPTNQTSQAYQGLWINQPVFNAWARGFDGSKVSVAILDDFTPDDISEARVVTLPNTCGNFTLSTVTFAYCSTGQGFVYVLTHGEQVNLILSGKQVSRNLIVASTGTYANPLTPTIPAGTYSVYQGVLASRSTPGYGVAFGAAANRNDYLTFQKNTNGLFDQLQKWGAGSDTISSNFRSVKVVNLSLGGISTNPKINTAAYSQQLAYANAANSPDAVFVKAAGNSTCTISATNCDAFNAVFHNSGNFKDKSLIVGALASAGGGIASYSNRAGSYSDKFVVADGRGMLQSDGTYIQGTSFAAPRVSGYVSILRQKYPNLSAQEAASIILSTAKWNPAWGSKDATNQAIYGQGEADLDHALSAIGSLP